MGQKVSPIGMRVGVIRDWQSRWYADDKEFGSLLVEDVKIREFIENYELNPAIGFNDLPTSMEELRHIQDNDRSYHPELDEKDILYKYDSYRLVGGFHVLRV